MKDEPVYIFSGLNDTTVVAAKQEAQEDFYENYESNIKFVQMNDTGHEVPSLFNPDNDYDYDMAGDLFTHILTNLVTDPISTLNAAN